MRGICEERRERRKAEWKRGVERNGMESTVEKSGVWWGKRGIQEEEGEAKHEEETTFTCC